MTRRSVVGTVVAFALATVAGCADTDQGVSTGRADAVAASTPTSEPPPSPPGTDAPPPTDAPPTTTDAPPPTDSLPLNTDPQNPLDPPDSIPPLPPSNERIDFGENHTPREYDALMNVVLDDVEAFFAEEVPAMYGIPFVPVTGVYAHFVDRSDLPPGGCGEDVPWERVENNAFFSWCNAPDGGVDLSTDVIIYDDEIMMPDLVSRFGIAASGASVIAHEYGHAISALGGVYDLGLPTVFTEQQADCFSGAWAARIARGESDALQFTDADLKAFIVATIEIGDVVGSDVLAPGGHGTAFDRVGAVQEGFLYGAQRCADFVTAPYPRIDLVFSESDYETGGNLAFDELLPLVSESFDVFWGPTLEAAGVPFTAPTIETFASADGAPPACGGADPAALVNAATFCADTNTILFDLTFGEDLHARFGDMAATYPLAVAYATAVQAALGIALTGEPQALLGDCLTGAWILDIVPADGTDPEAPVPRNANQPVVLSAGDLDEVVQVAVMLGDEESTTNVRGTAFEKVDAFRHGVLNGMSSCQPLVS